MSRKETVEEMLRSDVNVQAMLFNKAQSRARSSVRDMATRNVNLPRSAGTYESLSKPKQAIVRAFTGQLVKNGRYMQGSIRLSQG